MKETPNPTILLRLYGSDVKPENVPVRKLAELIQAVQSLANTKIHLVKIKRTSAGYAFSADDRALAFEMLQRSGAALKNPADYLQSSMIASFDTFGHIARSLKCKIQIRSAQSDWIWNFAAKKWSEVRSNAITTDEAVVYGRLIRVGGATANKCGIQVPNQRRMLICKIQSSELARRLGRHIYQDVTLYGKATFFTRDYRILSFQVESFNILKNESFQEMYEAIRSAGGRAWDDVADPLVEIEELR